MVVARLLTPDEIGTFAIASGIVMVMAEFRMLGAAAYLIREPDIGPGKVRSTLGLTLLISWFLGIAILASGFPLAEFYDLSPIAGIFAILSVSFFVAPYISIPMTLLARQLHFKMLFRINLISSVFGAVTTVGLIILGLSYWALALGQLARPFAQFVIFLIVRPEKMEFKPSFRGLGPIAGFGAFNSIGLLLRKATVTVPDMVIGKMGPPSDVAMFSRGLGFIEFVSQTLVTGAQPVAFPYLTKTRREGGNLADAYIKASTMLGAVLLPVLGVGSLASLPAIRLFFGDQWDAAAPVASIMAIWAMLRCTHWFARDALMAVGKEGWMVVREAVPFAILVPSIVLAYPSGLEAVAKVFLVTGSVDFALTFVLLHFAIGLKTFSFLLAAWKNLLVLAICSGATWLISTNISFDTTPSWQVIGVLAATLPVVWLASLVLFRHPLGGEIYSVFQSRFGRS